MRARLAATILFSASAFAQSQQQTPQQTGANPPAGREAIFHRAMTMYTAKNYGPALRAFEEAADAGNVEAMMHLGIMYSEGQGTPVKIDEAIGWFRKAAVGGDRQGMCNLGSIYYQGRGVPQQLQFARLLVGAQHRLQPGPQEGELSCERNQVVDDPFSQPVRPFLQNSSRCIIKAADFLVL